MSAPAPGNGFWIPQGLFSDNAGQTLLQALQIVNGALAVYQPGGAVELGGTLTAIEETLRLILTELRVHTTMLADGLNVSDDPAVMRNDFMTMGHYPSD